MYTICMESKLHKTYVQELKVTSVRFFPPTVNILLKKLANT